MRLFAFYAALFISEIVVAVGAGWLVGLWAIPAAYNERGYEAIGGEWALILAVTVTAYIIYHNWLFKRLGKPTRKEQ